MDPLSVLRDYAMRGELDAITRSGDELRFGSEYVFPCSTVTGYRSKQGGFYSLETLLFFIRNHHLKHTDYLQATRPIRLPAVTFPDRKPLLDYLLGRSASSDNLVHLPPFSGDPAFAPPGASGDEYHPSDEPLEVPSADDGGSRVPDREAEEIVSYIARIRELERPLKDREAMLECRNRDFHAVLLASTRREEERQRLESQQRKDGLVAKMRVAGSDDHHHRTVGAGDDASDAMAKAKLHLKGGKIGEGVPIILVPSASQTLITIHNVKEFLEDGVFVPTDAKVKAARGPKPDCVTVQKKLSRDRAVTAYEVRDKTSSFKADEWDRVVAVFVLGKEWQFKDWPFKDHVEIFNKVIGFYVRFEDDSLESAKMVKQWNVKIITISKNKRHQDRAAALEVWEKLEQFMRSRAHQ